MASDIRSEESSHTDTDTGAESSDTDTSAESSHTDTGPYSGCSEGVRQCCEGTGLSAEIYAW